MEIHMHIAAYIHIHTYQMIYPNNGCYVFVVLLIWHCIRLLAIQIKKKRSRIFDEHFWREAIVVLRVRYIFHAIRYLSLVALFHFCDNKGHRMLPFVPQFTRSRLSFSSSSVSSRCWIHLHVNRFPASVLPHFVYYIIQQFFSLLAWTVEHKKVCDW